MRNSYITSSEEETFLLGYYAACRFKNFKTFILVGDLGVGKTVFVRGFCEYHGVNFVRSPTFLVINKYKGINHADLYRVESFEDIYTSGILEVLNREILLVEWGEKLLPFLGSSPYVLVEFKFLDMERREIIISPRPS
ncbi:tRNA (adenosine(37)-N6)-threonylcarbamoyltransferase complex ATPase subunit type 1 TsaE [Candidatus Caldipriscus sp.]|nr:tRNA (adenosine(37)-N6)-threonylcarbamoyltransferase complex ATPase subunit type 1 TsaE [Candidatus Caldipriscus sp.]